MVGNRLDCPVCDRQFDALEDVRSHLVDDHTQEAVVYRLLGALEVE